MESSNKPSGAAKRKKKKENEEKEAAAKKKVPLISTFLKKVRNNDEEQEDVGFEASTSRVSSESQLTVANVSSDEIDGDTAAQPQQTEEGEQGASSGSAAAASAIIPEDPALWGSIAESAREEILCKGLAAFQHRAAKYPASRFPLPAGKRKRTVSDQ